MAPSWAAPAYRRRHGNDEHRSSLDAAAGYRFEAAVVLVLAYGMRRGEVLGPALARFGLDGWHVAGDTWREPLPGGQIGP